MPHSKAGQYGKKQQKETKGGSETLGNNPIVVLVGLDVVFVDGHGLIQNYGAVFGINKKGDFLQKKDT